MKTEVVEKIPTKLKIKQLIAYVILLVLVSISAMMVVSQEIEYRQDQREMSYLMRERNDLNAEWGRLLIEQQPFGATAQIGTRAVTQLRMYSPPAAQTVVISLPTTSEDKK